MSDVPDLDPTAKRLAALVTAVRDDQLGAPTPCERYTLGDLLDHVSGLSQGLAAAAAKQSLGGSPPPSGAADRLGDRWRDRIAGELDALVEAWRQPAAWEGMTSAGGIDLPGGVAGRVTLNELVVHGWDVAMASGQRFDHDPKALDTCLQFVEPAATSTPPGEGPFGPVVDVPADAPTLHRLLGLTGRDPDWQAP